MKKLQNDGNVRRLWHGTGGTDPKRIGSGEDGLNIYYSNDGMWGNGLYSAQNAKYSCPGYSFPVPGLQKTYEVFLCEFVLGDCLKQDPTKGQKEPPINNNTGLRYDSVTGYTGGSDVFIVYKNTKVYPLFLVRY